MMAGSLGALIALGVLLLVSGFRRSVPRLSTRKSTGLWKQLHNRWLSWSHTRRVWVIASFALGAVVAVTTGWLIAVVLIPTVILGVPALLSEPPQHEIATLAGLDRWVRLLAPSIATGKSIRDAILSTRSQAPAVLTAPVTRMVARIDQGWTTKDALLAMADDLASADADAVLAALAISSTKGGVGTRTTLTALSENTQQRLHALREISAERAKTRAVVRQVTIITLVVLGGSILLGGNFFEPYRSPLGQTLALSLAAAYMGALVMLRRRTIPMAAARFLRGSP